MTSPLLVGSVTVLVVLVAIVLAYNANSGLPFIPTYDLRAEIPSGGKLVRGNEVRIGGFQVGTVDRIRPRVVPEEGERRAIAVVDLRLDKRVEPLARDTTVQVRPRSVFGLKYVQLVPGRSRATYGAGDTIPLRFASEAPEIEDQLAIFDGETRRNQQIATEGLGDALAGRGSSLNEALGALGPFFRHLTPVMRSLSDPDTRLQNLVRQLGRTNAQLAPVADVAARLFTDAADSFAAVSRDPAALRASIERTPGTLAVSTPALADVRLFLADLTDVSRDLRPASREIPKSLPALNRALLVGTPVLRRSPELSDRVRSVSRELEELFADPNTLLALNDLRTTEAVTRPALEYIAPYQTVCNYFVYFVLALGEHQSQVSMDHAGTMQNQGVKIVNPLQPNNYGTTENSRPVDIPPDQDPIGARDAAGNALHRFYAQPYQPAVDAQGNADCQIGQNGWVRGPFVPSFARYKRGLLRDGTPTGVNWAVGLPNLPGLSGGTDVTRRLGIDNVRDVP